MATTLTFGVFLQVALVASVGAQDEGRSGSDVTTASTVQPGAGQTRGIARRPAATTPPTFTTVTTPPVATTSVTTPTTTTASPPTTTTTPEVTLTTQVAFPEEEFTADGASDEGDTSFLPQLPPSSVPATTTALPPTTGVGDEVEDGQTTGWFAGATVTDGGLLSSSATPTSVQPPTTLAPVVTTSEVPAPPTTAVPTTAAPTATVPESNESSRDPSRSRMSGLLEVAAVIGGVLALSAVPVMLARLIRTRRQDEMLVAE